MSSNVAGFREALARVVGLIAAPYGYTDSL